MTNKDGISVEGVRALLEGTTPGPWALSESLLFDGQEVVSEDRKRLAYVGTDEANADLFAAAPSIARAYLALSEEKYQALRESGELRVEVVLAEERIVELEAEALALSERVGEILRAEAKKHDDYANKRDQDGHELDATVAWNMAGAVRMAAKKIDAALSHKGMDHG